MQCLQEVPTTHLLRNRLEDKPPKQRKRKTRDLGARATPAGQGDQAGPEWPESPRGILQDDDLKCPRDGEDTELSAAPRERNRSLLSAAALSSPTAERWLPCPPGLNPCVWWAGREGRQGGAWSRAAGPQSLGPLSNMFFSPIIKKCPAHCR